MTNPDSLPISLVVQIESVGRQYVHAKLMPPWRTQVVGRDWREAESKLRSKALAELRRSSPRKWLMGDHLSALPIESSVAVPLESPVRSPQWTEPIELTLQVFHWEFSDAMALVRVPSIGCELFGPTGDIDEAVIREQMRVSLLRMGDRFTLDDVRRRFYQRTFAYRLLELDFEIRPEKSAAAPNDPKAMRANFRKKTVTLRAVASNLMQAQLDPVFGRDQQARDLIEYLSGLTPQSVLLVGPAGVGKTAVVHQLVHQIKTAGQSQPASTLTTVDSKLPGSPSPSGLPLAGRIVWSTTGSRLVSGMSGLGMWQERCLKLIREAHATQAIVHVGSVTELMEAGKIEGQPGVASMIRQAVARGRLLIIAECTPEQVAIVEREEPLLLRSLVRYDVSEPPPDEINEILKQASRAHALAAQGKHKPLTQFSNSSIEELHRLHRRYATYSALPAQPLRLMQSILEHSPAGTVVESADVARAFAKQTGLPRFLVDDSIDVDLDKIRTRLTGHVIGQSEPIELVVNLIATLKSRLTRPGRPLASLMFIGPTGVGKTEMAKALAGLLYSDTRRMVRIDMSEYSTPWSAVRLIGRPDEGDGTLTSPIREQPFSVVLLDEFEKADPTVFDLLLQLLGEGRLTDSLGRLADFRNAVVIMTSNLGVESFRESGFGFNDASHDWRSHFEREVQRFVRPELLGRIDRIVPFAPLPREVVKQIALREINLLKERPGIKYNNLQLVVQSEVVDHLCALGYKPKYGARPLRRAIEQHLSVPLANAMTTLTQDCDWQLTASLKQDAILIHTARVERTSGQPRNLVQDSIDQWQSLARMARLALQCGALRDIENETERRQRVNDSLFDRLKETHSARRTNNLKTEIQENAVIIERNRQLAGRLHKASQDIVEAHKSVLLDWYRNSALDQNRLFILPEELRLELRGAILGLTEGRTKKSESIKLLIIGKPIARAAVLWQAYEQIAKENKWVVEWFTLRAYDALKDKDSPQFRKRQSQRRDEAPDGHSFTLPTMRLLGRPPGDDTGSLVKTCDVYRELSSQPWLDNDHSIAGVALGLNGQGVLARLGNEYGVMHFIDTGASGPKRRQRFRVAVEESRLLDINMPTNWPEQVAPPLRDPRRTFQQVENTIVDGLTGQEISCGNSKMLDCLIQAINDEREAQIWEAIGYEGTPYGATLVAGDIPIPF